MKYVKSQRKFQITVKIPGYGAQNFKRLYLLKKSKRARNWESRHKRNCKEIYIFIRVANSKTWEVFYPRGKVPSLSCQISLKFPQDCDCDCGKTPRNKPAVPLTGLFPPFGSGYKRIYFFGVTNSQIFIRWMLVTFLIYLFFFLIFLIY